MIHLFRNVATSLAAAFTCVAVAVLPHRLEAGDPETLGSHGVELFQKGDALKGLDRVREAYRMNPYNPDMKRMYADAILSAGAELLHRGKHREAEQLFMQGEDEFPEDARFMRFRGVALYLLKQYDGAKYELEQSLKTGGEDGDSLLFLGRVLYDSGNVPGAVDAWRRGAKVAPDNAQLKELLAKGEKEMALEERMGKGFSSRFQLSYDGTVPPATAGVVLEFLESVYNHVGADFGRFPAAQVPVILYAGRDYTDITASPDWAGGSYDGKIRIPVRGLSDLTPQLRNILTHEYTHALVFDLTRGKIPVWLNEGLAECEGRKEYNPPLKSLAPAVRERRLIPLRELQDSFRPLGADRVGLAYEQSYAFVNYLLESYGWGRMADLLARIGEGMKPEPAFTELYGADSAALFAEWTAREYGASP